MSIQILLPSVVSKIAAGEVVERPASVVKELLENSLDSGASHISIEAKGGGIELIKVIDNGSGIAQSEVELAFERHATSKISSEKDIEVISSLGFRGEALPTIASVAEVTVLTRHSEDNAGTLVRLENGVIVSKTSKGCPQGTTITVANLFKNVPARLKFLKSSTTESGHISQMVTQQSLAFPEVKIHLDMNGRNVLRTSGNGSLQDVLIEIYGIETARSMLEISSENRIVAGFISPSSVSRSNRNHISLFVNRRWVQSRNLNYAIEEAYQGMLMTGKHPVAVLNITLPQGEIDVNVHPSKREIKFRNEREVFSAIQKAVRETLIGYSPVPSVRHASTVSFMSTPASIPFPSTSGIKTMYSSAPLSQRQEHPQTGPSLPILRTIGQFQNAYVAAEGPDGLYLIDQHAAHERILFEKIQRDQESHTVEIQGLLEPISVDLTIQEANWLDSSADILSESGFSLERFGERTYLLRAVPAFLKSQEIMPVLIEILDCLGTNRKTEWRERIAASMACHGAIKAGQVLDMVEMDELLRQLEGTRSPRTCPHGRPTMIQLSGAQLEKEFGRHS